MLSGLKSGGGDRTKFESFLGRFNAFNGPCRMKFIVLDMLIHGWLISP